MSRGGSRNGRVGQAYANRTDLNGGSKPLPVATVPGQPYGQAGEQAAAQAAVPMGGTPTPPMTQAPSQPTGPLPGELPSLTAPTARPDEALTHGLGVGAGAGPEALPQMGVAVQYANTRDLITSLAQQTNSPALNTLAAYARNGL